jgi:hypothetical protein
MTDPAPTPWTWTGTTINDADGRLVAILSQRLSQQEVLIAEIMAAREMHELLVIFEQILSRDDPDFDEARAMIAPDRLLLDEVRAMLTRLGGDE